MTVENEDYELEVLEYAVNQCIDSLLSKSSEDILSEILNKSNEVVWRVAIDIYTKSGHKIDFSFVRNLLNLRIEPLRIKIAEEERIKAELEAKTRIREAEKQSIKKEKEELEVFERIKSIIAEQLEVDGEQVKLDTLFEYLIPESYNDWQNRMKREKPWCSSSSFIYDDRDLDSVELIMVIEEEFDIEILYEECENLLSWNVRQLVNLILQKI